MSAGRQTLDILSIAHPEFVSCLQTVIILTGKQGRAYLQAGATCACDIPTVARQTTADLVCSTPHIGGCLLFGEEMPLMRLAGICVAMAGIVWYSVLKLGEVTTAARQLLPSTANGSHSPVALAYITSNICA